MATVFLATQDSLQREVALKVMAPALAADRTFAQRFVGEARTIGELNHPNIVSIHDVGVTEDKLHYFSMQLLSGGDLEQRIAGGITERELLRIIQPICSALGHAHERGFVHRDVTPGNIMFDPADQPVLTDFGIARVVSEATRMTATGLSMGTSYYMSPEQARGRNVDARSDIYSLGAVIVEVLTGKPPYEGDDSFAVAYAHVYEPVPKLPPRFLRWQEFVARCMAKSPSDRYDSMAQVLEVLEEFARKTTGEGRRFDISKADKPAADMGATLQLPVPEISPAKSGRLRWAGLALGKGPVEWWSGLRPAWRRAWAWFGGKLERLPPLLWVGVIAGVSLLASALFLVLRGSPEPPLPAVSVTQPTETPDLSDGLADPTNDAVLEPVADLEPEPEPEPAPLPTVESIQPSRPVLVDLDETDEALLVESLLNTPQGQARLQSLLEDASTALAENRLTTPADDNAFDLFQSALSLDPDNSVAQGGMEQIIRRYVALARSAVDRGRYQGAITLGLRARQVARQITLSSSVAEALDSVEEYGYSQSMTRAQEAQRVGDLEWASEQLRAALLFKPNDAAVFQAMDQLSVPPEPEGPQVVRDVLANGDFGPELLVTDGSDGIGLGLGEITVDQFAAYVSDTGADPEGTACRNLESWMRASRKRHWRAPGFDQDGDHPVVCVSWGDATAYADWLSDQTGKPYRLIRVNDWAQAAQQPADDCQDNLGDQRLLTVMKRREVLDCDDGFAYTAPITAFAPSATSVTGLLGNVREWTADCVRERSGVCRQYAVVGMSWLEGDRSDFGTTSKGYDPEQRYNTIGFRVVREP